jgi:hypothetical protein
MPAILPSRQRPALLRPRHRPLPHARPDRVRGRANLYAYARHHPTNLIDPSGEILPCLAWNYLRCMTSCMLLSGAADYFLECGNVDSSDNAKDCAVDCLIGMLPIHNPCGKFGQWFGMAAGAAGAAGGGLNSFSADTLVHVMPQGAAEHDAQQAKAELRPIGQLKPGDRVLAIAEWKDKGQARNNAGDALDARLAYEKVTDIYNSRKEQVLVHLTLDNGEQLTATEGHPFKTSEGWRDAILLKRGGKLLLKGSDGDGSDRTALIAGVRVERKTVQVFNLEVANAHTFFVGVDGALVHNGHGNSAASTAEQIVYGIYDVASGATQKYGITGCKPKKNGKYRRPEMQLKPGEDYRVRDRIPSGPNARQDALDRERQYVVDYRNNNNNNNQRPPRNMRP